MPQYIKEIKSKELVPSITGNYAHGNNMTLGYVELKAGSIIPLHQNMQEQITYIIEGHLDMMINGKTCLLTDGMYHVIPSNAPHSAIARTDCRVIDAFSPVREDYKQ